MGAVWAITRLTLISAVRRRTPIVLILLAVVLGPVFSMFLEGDQRLEGLIKTVLTWNVAFISGAMMALAVFLASNVVGRDIAEKQLFMVDSKPVRRWQVLVGKWLGLTLLSGWLLLLAWGATYLVVFAFSAVGRHTMWGWARAVLGWGATAAALAVATWLALGKLWGKAWWGRAAAALAVLCAAGLVRDLRAVPVRHDARAADMADVRQRLLVSRRSFRPAPPADLEAEVERQFRELRGEIERLGTRIADDEWAGIRGELRDNIANRMWPVPYVGQDYGGVRGTAFTFTGVPADAQRYAPEVVVRYQFLLRRGIEDGGNGTMLLRFPTRSGMVREFPRAFKHRGADEIAVPVDVVLRNGELEIAVVNTNAPRPPAGPGESAWPAGQMFLPLADGLEVLVPVGRFDLNLARGFALLWIRLAMIAMVGVALNTFVSGPVAALALMAFVTVGLGNSGWIEQMRPDPLLLKAGAEQAPAAAMRVAFGLAEAILTLAPNFDQTNPVPDLIVGREIPWWRLLWQALWDVGVRGGLALAIGVGVFTRRELAKPTAIT